MTKNFYISTHFAAVHFRRYSEGSVRTAKQLAEESRAFALEVATMLECVPLTDNEPTISSNRNGIFWELPIQFATPQELAKANDKICEAAAKFGYKQRENI